VKYSELYAVNLGLARRDHEIVRYWDVYIAHAEKCGLKLLSWNVWDQGQVGSVGKLTAMFPIEHEFIFVFGKEAKDLTPTIPNKDANTVSNHTADRQSDGSVQRKKAITIRPFRELGTVARVNIQLARNVDASHPAMFSVELPELYIEACSPFNSLVLDPFGGSGTTMVACEQLARLCRMIELEPKYVAVILERMAGMGLTPRLTDS
jgi:DNA modification methylase